MRARISLLLLVLLLVGCAGPTEPVQPTLDTAEVQIRRLRDAMGAVAEAQADADHRLGAAVRVTRQVDRLVAGFRDEDRIDTQRELADDVAAEFGAVDIAPLRPEILDIARRVDRARIILSDARSVLDDPWDQRYLEAEDELLQAVRTYAEAADALAQVLELRWPVYEDAVEKTVAFAEEAWFYRSDEEAVAAYEVRLGRTIDDLGQAQDEIERYRAGRDEQARTVNAATADAAAVWASRPDDLDVPDTRAAG